MAHMKMRRNFRCVASVICREILIVLFCAGIVIGKKCTLGSIKSGYSLKNGLEGDNVKLLGSNLGLEGCKLLCCDTESCQYGLHDGHKCFAVQCFGNADNRCTLTQDGNAVFTIFALKRGESGKSLVAGSNEVHLDPEAKTNKNEVHVTKGSNRKSKKSHHREEHFQKNSKVKNSSHRKHKKKRRHQKKKSKKPERTARDYPYEYFQTPLWKLTNKRTNANIQTLTRSSIPQYQYYNLLTGRYGQPPSTNGYANGNMFFNNNNNNIYSRNRIYGQNTWNNYQPSQYYGQFLSPSTGVVHTPNAKALITKPITKQVLPVNNPIKNASSIKYQAKYDIMTPEKKAKSGHVSKVDKKNSVTLKNAHVIGKKTNIPVRPAPIKKKETIIKPTPTAVQTDKEKSQILSQIDVQPLSEFSSDNELSHTVIEKDLIPRPEDFQSDLPRTLISKDSAVDIPISSTVEQLKAKRGFLSGLLLENNMTPDNDNDRTTYLTTLPIKDSTLHDRKDIPNSLYSMLYPLSTIQRESFQKLFLERCLNPVGISQPRMIPDDNISASSAMDGFDAANGRLKMSIDDNGSAWCASKNSVDNQKLQYLSVDLGRQTMFCRIGTQGYPQGKKWVDNFKLEFSDDGKYWEPYRENGETKVFYGNHDEKDVTFQTLKNPIMARFVRFQPIEWTGDVPCLRVEIFNTTTEKDDYYHTRSEIPKAEKTLMEDISFEKMDETVALDRSTYGNNGLLFGGSKVVDTHSSCRHGVEIPLGGDIVFDGSVMRNHPREAITITTWVKLNRVGGVHSIFDTVGSHSRHSLGQFHFEIVGGDVRWFHRNETGDEVFSVITEEKVIKPNIWNHIAVTYDSNTKDAIIYVNGTEKARSKGSGLLSTDWNSRVGIGRHKGSRFLDGTVDEFKLYGEALQKDAIEELAIKCDFSKYYCGSTLNDYTGTVVSPAYPNTFTGPVDCTWNIHGQPGEIIVLDMSQFNLGDKKTCGKANFEVRDGMEDSVLGTFCGAALTPKKIMSHSNRMYIRYTTDGALPGENFKVEYYKEKKRTAKKTLSNDCSSTRTLNNVTLIGGTKAGKFTQLGMTTDMDVCKQRCCHSGECDAAFLIGNNCYSVKCNNKDLCRVRKAKSSSLNPRIAFMSQNAGEDITEPAIEDLPLAASSDQTTVTGDTKSVQCSHQPILNNMTLIGGIRSGKFTSHGHIQDMPTCIQRCCERDDCDLAFMVKNTCFSLHCEDDKLCRSKPAKPSPYYPMVAYMTRYKPQQSKTEMGTAKGEITNTANEKGESKCKDMRVSKMYDDVTLSGGINSGDFTDKGHVANMDECVSKCCDTDTCNVAFVIKNTCFLVKCKSYKDCGLKSAISDYYNPKIAYINWNPPKDLDESVPYTYKGCWRDFDITAFAMPLMEGTDPKLSEPYKKRSDPVNTCAKVAQDRGYKVFAVQNGGACFSGSDADQNYKRYGKSESCKNGKGGPFANNVYKTFDDGSVIGLGCWADLKDRAFRRMEKNDPQLRDSFQQRADPIGVCAKVAEKMKMPYFALQKGGQCFVGKSNNVEYDRYSPSRKCKYGLGGQMANDVYMLTKNFTAEGTETSAKAANAATEPVTISVETNKPTVTNANETSSLPTANTTISETINNAASSLASGIKKYDDKDIELGEKVYKEDIAGEEVVRYVYKADEPIFNVTLRSAINAGKFEDKGKVDSINDCIKICGEKPDCDVAFMLSYQCFNIHCKSEDSCKTKPAFSNFYKPQLAYIKHRSITKHRNTTASRTSLPDMPCPVKTELSNVTFIEGVNSGNFTDMGHVASFGECKQKCCNDKRCHIAFKIQDDCYGVSCFSRESCRTRPAKNANVFTPEMALMRSVKNSLEEIQKAVDVSATVSTIVTPENSLHDIDVNAVKKENSPKVSTTTAIPTTLSTTTAAIALIGTTAPVSNTNMSQIANQTQANVTKGVNTITEATIDSDHCLRSEWDNKTIFNHTLVGGINAGDFREHGQSSSMKECMGHCCSEKHCDLSFMIDQDCYTVKCFSPDLCKIRQAKTTSFIPMIAFRNKSNIIGINEALDFVKDTVNELTLDGKNVVRPFKVLYKGLVNVNSPTDSLNTDQDTSLTSSSSSSTNDEVAPQKSNTTSLRHSVGEAGKSTLVEAEPTMKHSCNAGKIIYNATLRLGMHSGMFTKLGRVKSMDDCIERCCRSSNADVAYKLGSFCFAVKCRTRDLCKPSPTMFSDITSLNLNPAISFLNEDKIPLNVLDDSEKETLESVFKTAIDSDDLINSIIQNMTTHDQLRLSALRHHANRPTFIDDTNDVSSTTNIGDEKSTVKTDDGTCSDSPITYNVTLRGGIHAGKFTQLGSGIGMRDCVSRCCNTPLCDVAFMFSDKCYAVGCYSEDKCQAVLAKPSSLSPKLAYVSKYRGSYAQSPITDGIEFKVNSDNNVCSVNNVKHGPVYTNRTLLGGMKAGNFSYLGKASDINHCLSKCCSTGGCDLAYLVNKDQCFSVKCFTPELCQVTDKLFNNKQIEFAKLVKPPKHHHTTRGLVAAYFAVGLLATVIGVAGFLWAALIFVKRNELKKKHMKKNSESDENLEFPRPDRNTD